MAAETRLRVLHVIPSVAISDGGPSHAMAAIEAALSDAGIAVTTATTDHDYRGQGVQPSGVMARDPRVERHYARKRIGFYKVAPGLVPYFLHSIGSYDVVHIHALFSFAPVVAAWIARWRNVPYIVRPLGTLGSYGVGQRRRRLKRLSIALIEGPILRHAAAVHFTSQSELDEAGRTGIACRGVVIPLGVPGPPRANAGLREQHSFPGQCRSVLFLSRLDPKKNIEGLIDAFGASQELQRTCRLLIAGDGPLAYVEALKRRVALAGFGEQVVWLGHVADESKAAAFARADVFGCATCPATRTVHRGQTVADPSHCDWCNP